MNTSSANQQITTGKQQANANKAAEAVYKQPVNSPKEATRVFVVLNPVAGLTNAVAAKETITTFCQERRWHCEIHETEKDEDLRALVRAQLKKGTDIVIAAGGDGTVSAVVSGMVNANIPMAILPAGTGNALARDLSIPMDLGGALNMLASDYAVEEMDIMEVSAGEKKDFYVMNVSVGVSSIVMGNTAREEKRRFGFLAYVYHAVRTMMRPNLQRYQIKADNRALRTYASEVMIANCKFAGLQPQIDGVQIDSDDGRLDMFIVRARSLRGYLNVLTRFILRRKADEDSRLRYLGVNKSIEIRSDRPMPVQADGEVIGRTPVSVRLIPKALRVIVPVKELEKAAQG